MQYLISIALVFATSIACFYAADFIGYRVVAMVLLMTASIIAMLFDIYPVLTAAILSAVIWNFFFIPPIYTFHIYNAEDLLMFSMYFLIGLINAVLTFKIREAEKKAREKEDKENTIKLYDTLLNSLSHELRTPISTILGAVDTLRESKDRLSLNVQNELLAEIDNASIRLNRQVGNLLNMSRLESGVFRLTIDWCDMNELINSILQKITQPLNHRIEFSPNENLPLFKMDAGLMEQVLQNLIHNAIQYTPEDSSIRVEVLYQSDHCIITISDNGVGFLKTETTLAFEKFYRSPKAKSGGIGLGLSIVKGFVEAHRGQIQLENNKDGGAKFTIRIPVEISYLNTVKNE